MNGFGDSTSPRGVHHALQGACHCIISDFQDGSDELQQVTLHVPVSQAACRHKELYMY